MNDQYYEAIAIADKLAPFCRGAFIVGGCAYDAHPVRDKIELEVIAVVPNFARADFRAIQNALGRELNPNAVKHASAGKMGVFDTHYMAKGGFATGIYLRSTEAHEAVCNLGSYGRFTDKPKTPRSCSLWSIDNGEERVWDESETVEGGKIYRHHSVLDEKGRLWVGFPALNILMKPSILHGREFLQSSFDTFNENLRAKIRERYGEGNKSVSLVKSIPQHFAHRVPQELKVRLEHFMD
jgi:hypothetical protein